MAGQKADVTGNPALAAAILEAGCSNAGLALRVNQLATAQGLVTRYDKASVTRWVRYGDVPRVPIPQLIAEAIGSLLGRRVDPAALGFPADPHRDFSTRTLTYRRSVHEALQTTAELGGDGLSRRSLLTGALPFVSSALHPPQRAWLLHLLNRDPSLHAAVADSSALAQAKSMITMFDAMDNEWGGAGVQASIINYLTTQLIPQLRGTFPAGERPQLFTYAAKLAAMAGWSSYDRADYGLAQRYMIQALRLCEEGGDRVLAGQILAGLSHLATSLGNPSEGADLAETGIATARHTGSPLGLMRLQAMHARAHAALGNHRAATRALEAAHISLASSRGAESESPWVGYLDPHYLEAEAALVHRDLGEAVAAERLARASVDANANRRRRQAISRSVQATALLQQNDLDAALDTAHQALEHLTDTRSERSVQALRDFNLRLDSRATEPAVRAFRRAARPLLGAAA
ncbi:hypothetical protein [Kitasatospora sp. MBT63]|uniref:hypothetical protein n=1 Tax=Kitasatospora sp. MBT63 TaxID=1444768 RepID=UPI00053B5A7F|nr:hypothetical protein [Kitasatospora sp. MBT63]